MNDETHDPVDGDRRLTRWWRGLTELQREEAYGVGTHTPMPTWMVISLAEAGIPGLVDAPDKPEGFNGPWFYMPAQVARLIARRRRGDTS